MSTWLQGLWATVQRILPQHGVSRVVHATTTSPVVETAANAIQQAADTYQPNVIMGTATKWGSSVVPRAAALLQVSPLSDVVDIVDTSKYGSWLPS